MFPLQNIIKIEINEETELNLLKREIQELTQVRDFITLLPKFYINVLLLFNIKILIDFQYEKEEKSDDLELGTSRRTFTSVIGGVIQICH